MNVEFKPFANVTEAKPYVQELLSMAAGDADKVHRALKTCVRSAQGWGEIDQFSLQLLALADITGNADYRN